MIQRTQALQASRTPTAGLVQPLQACVVLRLELRFNLDLHTTDAAVMSCL
jgi:hypothetical protein